MLERETESQTDRQPDRDIEYNFHSINAITPPVDSTKTLMALWM